MDDEEDYALPIWAGELPLKVTAGTPVADPQLDAEITLPRSLKIAIPENLTNYHRRTNN